MVLGVDCSMIVLSFVTFQLIAVGVPRDIVDEVSIIRGNRNIFVLYFLDQFICAGTIIPPLNLVLIVFGQSSFLILGDGFDHANII